MLLIGLGNKSRSGKDTIADYLVSKYGFVKVSFASTLYDIMYAVQSVLGEPNIKDTMLLQELGDLMQKRYNTDVFINLAMKKIATAVAQNKSIVVSDVRFYEEFNRLHDANFTLIKVHRENRPIDRDPTHRSEVELDNASWDLVIDNNDSIKKLYEITELTLGL